MICQYLAPTGTIVGHGRLTLPGEDAEKCWRSKAASTHFVASFLYCHCNYNQLQGNYILTYYSYNQAELATDIVLVLVLVMKIKA